MIAWLRPQDPFPPIEAAREDWGGLLAIGADLSPTRLIDAYRRGIFPWGTHEGHPLWYSPDPRMVLFPDEFHCPRSLQKTLRKGRFDIRFDTDFAAVIAQCAATARPGQGGSWITEAMQAAYGRLFELGWAHCVASYEAGELVGGLYGVHIDQMFYGESMFAHRADASKVAFAHLVTRFQQTGVGLIDCQMNTHHLARFSGREIPRDQFLAHLSRLTVQAPNSGTWANPPTY